MNQQVSTSISGKLVTENLVGEGGEIERSEMQPGEGFLSAAKDPSSGSDFA
jgi:hypothetical protein